MSSTAKPDWTGAGETRKPVYVPDEYSKYFDITKRIEFDVNVAFTRESWHGRMRTSRGVGASMNEENLIRWNTEHEKMLMEYASDKFEILHFVSAAELTLR